MVTHSLKKNQNNHSEDIYSVSKLDHICLTYQIWNIREATYVSPSRFAVEKKKKEKKIGNCKDFCVTGKCNNDHTRIRRNIQFYSSLKHPQRQYFYSNFKLNKKMYGGKLIFDVQIDFLYILRFAIKKHLVFHSSMTEVSIIQTPIHWFDLKIN